MRIPSAGTPIKMKDLIKAYTCSYDFEEELKKMLRVKYCFAVNSGTTAFYIILNALKKLSNKEEVLLPAYTSPSLILPIRKAGLKYRLVDISLNTFNMDIEKTAESINNNTLAVLCVHMFGIPVDIEKARDIKGVFIIEDAASSFGTKKGNRFSSTFGDVGFISFNRGKNLSTTTGGAIVTDDDRLSAIISEEIRNIPHLDTNGRIILFLKTVGLSLAVRPWFYTLFKPFISKFKYTTLHQDFDSFQYTDFQRALGMSLLKKATNIFQKRVENGVYLIDALRGIAGIRLPVFPDGWQIVFNQFPLLVEDEEKRGRVLDKIHKKGVEAPILYGNPIHRIYEGNNFNPDPFPLATYLSRRLILIPTHPYMSVKNLKMVVDAIGRGLR